MLTGITTGWADVMYAACDSVDHFIEHGSLGKGPTWSRWLTEIRTAKPWMRHDVICFLCEDDVDTLGIVRLYLLFLDTPEQIP